MISSHNISTSDHAYLEQAVDLAITSVRDGGGPFGAIIVKNGEVLATGQNRVSRDNDPTAHAEVTSIRSACSALDTFSLEGCTLYTSCEPCPLCLAACLWARIDRVVFSADRGDAADGGFDDSEFHDLFHRNPSTWATPIVQGNRLTNSDQPFKEWLGNAGRVEY